jgi:uncharacterized SAM-binding protein YcdF (DUF218 family)
VLAFIVSVVVALVALCVGIGIAFDRRRLPSTPADAALVFGCGERWKVNARLHTALEVYRSGMARHLVVSGGVPMPDGSGLTEAEWLAARLVDAGVPAADVSLENRATNTAENAAFALPILEARGCRRVVLVMSDFEGIRAHLTAKRAWLGRGIEIYDCHAPSVGHWSRWAWWTTREGWSLTWYTLPRLFRYRLLPYLWARSDAG